jgi:predicted O-methyltransferase YrrM
MPSLKSFVDPQAYARFAHRLQAGLETCIDPQNLAAVSAFPPGHFYSPLLDVRHVDEQRGMAHDGPEMWENVPLRAAEQEAFFRELLPTCPPLAFPPAKSPGFRYYTENTFFCEADAYTLSAILRHARPKRLIEVGSGFSSAVMLDTIERHGLPVSLTFIEPYAERLRSLLSDTDQRASPIIERPVQEVPVDIFKTLEAGDVLFIDSSHVAKIGSDVAHLILRVLPVLQPGVWVHVHDIFYPFSYPPGWIKEGRAWNESLFLRAYFVQNPRIQVQAFNSFAAAAFPGVFQNTARFFVDTPGGSLWLKTVAVEH